MPKMFLSILAGTMMLAGPAFAGDLLSNSQMDTVTAGADINWDVSSSATLSATTNANHNVNATLSTTTSVEAVADASLTASASSTNTGSIANN